MAAIAVDMMQDYRTGYLVDANPTHQTSVQLVGSCVGAIVAIPTLAMLVEELGIGAGSSLPAPGATVWATMAGAMANVAETGELGLSPELINMTIALSLVGCVYAYLTVWPVTAKWMPSIFGIGIGMLVGIPTSFAIFLGGLIKWIVTLAYASGKTGEEKVDAVQEAGNDTMLAGASVFAAAAVVSIVLVLAVKVLEFYELEWFFIAAG